jgi:hypothetical protein
MQEHRNNDRQALLAVPMLGHKLNRRDWLALIIPGVLLQQRQQPAPPV